MSPRPSADRNAGRLRDNRLARMARLAALAQQAAGQTPAHAPGDAPGDAPTDPQTTPPNDGSHTMTTPPDGTAPDSSPSEPAAPDAERSQSILLRLQTLLAKTGVTDLLPFLRQPEELAAAEALADAVESEPAHGLRVALEERHRARNLGAEHARTLAELERVRAVALEMEAKLKGLLEAESVLGRLEHLHWNGGMRPTALCQLGNRMVELPIHPDLDLDELSGLQSWDWICIHEQERVVTGTFKDPELFHRAQGEVVEFKGWHDRLRRLVRVARQGNEEVIVCLGPELDDDALVAPARLVLQRDDERFAIAQLPAAESESRFEVPVDGIETRLDQLAGLDEVIEPLVRDILLRLVHPELRERFDLRPLRGLLLYSYAPGQGKTSLMRAMARWLAELGEERGFDVLLYVVKPNELKIVWHGGDAKLVREDLCGAIRARQRRERTRPLFQLVIMDEVDSLGSRAGGDDTAGPTSSAANDAVQALLAEMDGMDQQVDAPGQPPAHVLFCGLTNRPDLVDAALKRPGRFGDLVLEMPHATEETAAAIMAVYARHVPWSLGGEVCTTASEDEVSTRVLRPALARVFDAVVLRYATDGRERHPVTAGRVMASVHFMEAMNSAKKAAAMRSLEGVGIPAVTARDLADALLDQALSAAAAMEADRSMLRRQLRIKAPVTRVDLVPRAELWDAHALHDSNESAPDESAPDETEPGEHDALAQAS